MHIIVVGTKWLISSSHLCSHSSTLFSFCVNDTYMCCCLSQSCAAVFQSKPKTRVFDLVYTTPLMMPENNEAEAKAKYHKTEASVA